MNELHSIAVMDISSKYDNSSADPEVALDTLDETLILNRLNDEYAKILAPVMVTLSVCMLTGLVGNSMVVYVYWQWIKTKTTTKRIFIITLGLLDLTVCTVAIPFEIYDLRNQVLFQNIATCKVARILEYSLVLASGFVLVSVSVERYIFLCKPYGDFSKRKAKIVCSGCVVLALLIGGPSATFAGIKTTKIENTSYVGFECSMDSDEENAKLAKRIYYYFLSTIFFACICILIVIYTLIGALIRKYQKRATQDISSLNVDINTLTKTNKDTSKERIPNSADSTVTLRRGRKFFKSPVSIIVFFSVTVAFVASFLPHIVIRLLLLFGVNLDELMNKQTSLLVYNFLVRSYLVGNISNPFIYGILNKAFRDELKRCLRKLFRRDKFQNRKTFLMDL